MSPEEAIAASDQFMKDAAGLLAAIGESVASLASAMGRMADTHRILLTELSKQEDVG